MIPPKKLEEPLSDHFLNDGLGRKNMGQGQKVNDLVS